MKYICEKCGKIFDQKSNYLNHLNRKTQCSIETKLSLEQKKYKCKKCGEKFTALSNLCRHKKIYCKKMNCESDIEDDEKDGIENKNNNEITIKNENKINNVENNNETNSKEIINNENNKKEFILDIENELTNLIQKHKEEKEEYYKQKEEEIKIIENEKNTKGFFYILMINENLQNNNNSVNSKKIFKIGITKKQSIDKRLSQYPKFTIKVFETEVNNPFTFEGIIKKLFKHKFTSELIYGIEYFSGNINKMIKLVQEVNILFH
jgi:DNA-directed RNA polymerase subunit RPC12/RpoP